MDLSNWITLLGVIITNVVTLSIVSAKISNTIGRMEQCIADHGRRIGKMEDTHDGCHLKQKIEKIETKQHDLRNEDLPGITNRLIRIEQELKDINRRLDEIRAEMHRNTRGNRSAEQ